MIESLCRHSLARQIATIYDRAERRSALGDRVWKRRPIKMTVRPRVPACDTPAMDLFLGSRGLGALPGWISELPRHPRHALLIPTAGNPMPVTPWVDAADAALRTAGLTVDRLDLESATPADVTAALSRTGLVFVTGGFALFLLQHAQRTGFLTAVPDAVRRGDIAYAGMSSGAALAGPDLELYRDDDDPGRVTDRSALGLVDFYPLSHANRRPDEKYAPGDGRTFVPVRDDEAIIVHGSTWQKRPS